MDKYIKQYQDKLPKKIVDDLKEFIPKGLSDSKLKKIFELALEEYETAKVHPGESVGIISAESIGEPGTQMTVTLGLPRIIEILDGRKALSTPMIEIYLKKPYSKGDGIRKLAMSIKNTALVDITSEFLIKIADFEIEIKLNYDKMKELGITDAHVQAAVVKKIKGYTIKCADHKVHLKLKSKDENINEVYKTKEKLKAIHIRGIEGISQVLPVKREDEYVIITAGSNLAEILSLPEVNTDKTTTNNIFEIMKVLGIEAARQAIISEVFKVIESQGLNVDIRHIMLVADTMCISGEVKGVTRYGVVSEKASVLARASFETPIKHVINAALVGEEDKLNSVVENVMLNQPIPVGTGLPGLVTKQKNGSKS